MGVYFAAKKTPANFTFQVLRFLLPLPKKNLNQFIEDLRLIYKPRLLIGVLGK
jgi:hypothetical protein